MGAISYAAEHSACLQGRRLDRLRRRRQGPDLKKEEL